MWILFITVTVNMSRVHHCSHCRRPVKGHNGPYGPKCTLKPIDVIPKLLPGLPPPVPPRTRRHSSLPDKMGDEDWFIDNPLDLLLLGQHQPTLPPSGLPAPDLSQPPLVPSNPALPPGAEQGSTNSELAETVKQLSGQVSSLQTQLAAVLHAQPYIQQHAGIAGNVQTGIYPDVNNHALPHSNPATVYPPHQPVPSNPPTVYPPQQAVPSKPGCTTPYHPLPSGVSSLRHLPIGPDIPHPTIPGLRSTAFITDYGSHCRVTGIPDKTIKCALNGEFCSLEDFLYNLSLPSECIHDLQTYIDNKGQVQYKPKRQKRRITDLKTWQEAWAGFEETMVSFHGLQIYDQLVAYRLKIAEYDTRFNWHAVATFDMRHRASLDRRSIMFFTDIDPILAGSMMDATQVKQGVPRCLRCFSFDHQVSFCPFPQSSSAPSPSGSAGQKIQGNSVNSEICRNYNSEKSCTFKFCRRQHICKGCFGPMPYTQCVRSGKCAGQHSQTVQYQPLSQAFNPQHISTPGQQAVPPSTGYIPTTRSFTSP